MNDKKETVLNKINKLYENISYYSKYGFDVWISAIIIIAAMTIVSYFNLINSVQPIRANWLEERCKPEVMPFAGIINPSNTEQTSGLAYTRQNFAECQTKILDEVTSDILGPLNNQMGLVGALQVLNSSALNDTRGIISKIRDSTGKIFKGIFKQIESSLVPLTKVTTNLSDFGQKMSGMFVALVYVFFGTYDIIITSFMMLDDALIRCLVILSLAIEAAWFMIFTWPVALWYTGVMTWFMIVFFVPIQIFINTVLDEATSPAPSIPGKPACFDEETIIKLRDGTTKQIKNIEVGDHLIDDSFVTSFFKLSSTGQEFYEIFGITLTAKHRIFDEELGWVTADNHSQSKLIEDYRKPYIYCFNTNTKVININNNIFLDWDDLDELNLMDIRIMCVNNGLIPKKFEKDDIHKYLDCGLSGDMMIELEDGQSVKIKDVEVNDVLRFGEQVWGVVKIKADDMFYLRDFEKEKLKGSGNILINDPDLGVLNSSYLVGNQPIKEDYIYNLLTDTGFYHVNGIRISDYNSGLEQYLQYAWN